MIFGVNREGFAVQCPPGVRDVAVGDDAGIDDIAVFKFFRRDTFEIERLLGDQQTGTGYDFGFCKAPRVKKSAVASDGVVLGRIGVNDLVVKVIAIGNMAVRGEDFRVFVVFGFIGPEGCIAEFDYDHAVKPGNAAVGLLSGGVHVVVTGSGRVGAGNLDVEIGSLDGCVVRGWSGGRGRGGAVRLRRAA